MLDDLVREGGEYVNTARKIERERDKRVALAAEGTDGSSAWLVIP
jgi:hypothetical protein